MNPPPPPLPAHQAHITLAPLSASPHPPSTAPAAARPGLTLTLTNPHQVDSEGKLFASFKQQLSPLTLLTLASEVETVNLNEGKHKFGMALSLTP